jgi:CheY-like chemotaxis protein
MSHELRTPMNAIIGYSEMLAEDAEDEGHDEMIPDLEKINAAGKHLLALINDILDLSKIEAGRMDLFLESFDLRQMLDEAVATVMPLIDKNENKLENDITDNLGNVRVDLTKLRQALFNLLSNAAKFTEGGTITLAAAKGMRGDAEWLTVSVSDTGIGIAQDKLDAVFEEFSQADDSTTRDYGGTGLGLPISRRFCRMMGGDITVSSELGEGTTFTIELPSQVDALEAATGVAAPTEPKAEKVSPGGRPILVVDDDPNSCELLKRTLEADGFSVATAASGEEGLELARELRPSLITLDVLMPSMDGWSVLQEVKADPELESIPVLMISIVGDKDMGYTLGAVESLTKPVDRDRLRELARQYALPSGGGRALVVDDDRERCHRSRASGRESPRSGAARSHDAGDGRLRVRPAFSQARGVWGDADHRCYRQGPEPGGARETAWRCRARRRKGGADEAAAAEGGPGAHIAARGAGRRREMR